jgi:DNA-binding transcriptional MerR regulator
MDISEVAKKSGVAASALRYYERKGLIHSLESEGARRKFSPAVLDQLALIALGQAAGFSLDEIRVMFTPGGEPNIDRAMLAAKADELEAWSSG